jgi:TFIIF-interacting CTD phosphatase-like protein
LPVLGKSVRFLASEIQPAAFLFGSVSLSAVRKRNEHVQQRSRKTAETTAQPKTAEAKAQPKNSRNKSAAEKQRRDTQAQSK